MHPLHPDYHHHGSDLLRKATASSHATWSTRASLTQQKASPRMAQVSVIRRAQSRRRALPDGPYGQNALTEFPSTLLHTATDSRHGCATRTQTNACASQKKSWSVVTLKSLQISNPVWVVYLHVKAWPVMGFYRLPAPTGTKQIIQLPAHLSEFPPPINFTRVILRQVCHTACRVLWAEASSRGRLPRGITR